MKKIFFIFMVLLNLNLFGQIQFDLQTTQITTSESILLSPMVKTFDGKIFSVYTTCSGETFCRIDSPDGELSCFLLGENIYVIDFFVLDFDQDGVEELVVFSPAEINVFYLHGELRYSVDLGHDIDAVSFSDINSDDMEMLLMSQDDSLRIVSFSGQTKTIPFKRVLDCDILVEDINSDYMKDIIVLARDGNSSGVYIFLNQGGGDFSDYQYFGIGNFQVNSLVIANFGDGKSIVINAPWAIGIPNSLIINFEDGQFVSTQANLPSGLCPAAIATDLNSDGVDELIYLSGYCSQLEVIEMVDGEFSISNFPINEGSIWYENPNTLTSADVNADGKRDIVFLSDMGTMYKFINTSPERAQQLVFIPQGWSGISSYIIPSYPAVEDVFSPISNNLVIAKTMTGGIYYPGQNINTIGNWESQSAYVIKTSANCILPIIGEYETDMAVSLNAGWSLLPVLSADGALTQDLLSTVNLVIAKDVAGAGIYWPDYGINTLGYLMPGRAYYVLLTAPGEVNYANFKSSSFVDEGNLQSSLDLTAFNIVPTPITHNIAIPLEALSWFETGTIIGAFDQAGNCFGITVYDGKTTSLTVFGDDPTTPEKDGFYQGEIMNFKANGDEIEVSFDQNLDFSGEFVSNGLSSVVAATISATLEQPIIPDRNESIYPNPVVDILNIEMAKIPDYVQIIDMTGNVLMTQKVNSQNFGIDVSSLPKGPYFVRLTHEDGSMRNVRFVK